MKKGMPWWNRLRTSRLLMHGGSAAQRFVDSWKRDAEADTERQADAVMRRLTGVYLYLLGVLVALVPLMAIGYLTFFQDPALRFEAHGLYEATSMLAIVLGAFVTYVTWRCYLTSGEVFLRWLTLAFLGFTLIYLPHALLSQFSDEMMHLFIAYGPASRLAMGACFLVALERLGAPADPPEARRRPTTWGMALGIILAIDLGLAALILGSVVPAESVIQGMEALALALLVMGIMVITLRRIRLPLMIIYLLSMAVFAQASIAFMISDLWSHLWWLAHAIFIAGFFLLSYGVVHAFHTTRSFSTVYSQAEVMQQLREQQTRTQDALGKLETTNTRLSQQAATDWLTGVANRRQFVRQAKRELARAKRYGTSLSLLCLDLDHFKKVNDAHGHEAGDQVLKQVASAMQESLRPHDLLARVGGEEFQVLLPEADIHQAGEVAERIRSTLHDLQIRLRDKVVKITVSLGCAQMGQDGDDMDSLMRIGDQRLYEAKALGRDRVVAGTDVLHSVQG
ncbi:GGDEF domain-containing protein [Halomonas daqiaonensis]|uniref:diguanylate cyclase n=1 Tax=Halomonas daqiaonensis TaxID=650850 RepID=A0A1H7QW21_9GAMM|nr:GGDEF domain-containing protein [Halomonas daqiaonensis]SEL52122.1 diguanylate cyclase (GGDEF) domain-containing protein [Halomonas daqiaonensis]